MGRAERLTEVYRGNYLECYHEGSIAVVDEKGLRARVGDIDFVSYYRSSSKPIQILPLYELQIDKKYKLTDEELSIMSGSLACGPRQIEIVKSIMAKADIPEDIFIMLPCYPMWEIYATQYIREGKPASRLYHNCIGKHLGLVLMQREMGGVEADYWKLESVVQQSIVEHISKFTDIPAKDIHIGWDGCGVPVFGVPMVNMALSYLRLAAPDLIKEKPLRDAVERNVQIIASHPENLMDAVSLCGVLCKDSNIVGKIGADGVYTLGLKKERLGIAVKIFDGTTDSMPHILVEILKQLNYQNQETIKSIQEQFPAGFKNATGKVVGEKKAVFTLR
ncbi:MAG: asparaginase [Clostridia bacterium]|nr:asparaginase [Clostridia bacterium]